MINVVKIEKDEIIITVFIIKIVYLISIDLIKWELESDVVVCPYVHPMK